MAEIDEDTWMFLTGNSWLIYPPEPQNGADDKAATYKLRNERLTFLQNAIEYTEKAFWCFYFGAVDMQNQSVAEFCVLIAASVGCKNYIIS